MKTLESFNVLESFGFGNGLFQEVSELEITDVIGGSCGGSGGGRLDSIPFGCGSRGPCLPGLMAMPNGEGIGRW